MIWTRDDDPSADFAMGYPWHYVVRNGAVTAWINTPGSYMNDLYENW
jgi:hypothetical protein